jgi:hypothetical protein
MPTTLPSVSPNKLLPLIADMARRAKASSVQGAFGPAINGEPRFFATMFYLLFVRRASVSWPAPLHCWTKAGQP